MNVESFQGVLEKQFKDVQKAAPREKAWDHFIELGLPSKHVEVYRYIKLRKLFSQEFTPAKATKVTPEQVTPFILPACKESVLVFVNGHYSEALSNRNAISDRIEICSLDEARKTYGAFLNNQWAKSIKEETDPFAVLNGALYGEGCFIYTPPNCVVEAPIQLLHLADCGEESMMMLPRHHIFVGKLSQMDLISTHATLSGEGYFVNQVSYFSLEEGAQLHYYQHNTPDSSKTWLFDAVRVSLKRDSRFKSVNDTKGSVTVRNDYHVALTGENSDVQLNGVWMLDEQVECHTNIVIDHQAPHCTSMQLFKGVLDGVSRSSFEGKINVRQKAQKTDAFQLNNNLLLSDRANADSKPNLEIFADDVKASHGATIGQLNKDQLFYLKARGLSQKTAQKLLVDGFIQEVLERIPKDFRWKS